MFEYSSPVVFTSLRLIAVQVSNFSKLFIDFEFFRCPEKNVQILQVGWCFEIVLMLNPIRDDAARRKSEAMKPAMKFLWNGVPVCLVALQLSHLEFMAHTDI